MLRFLWRDCPTSSVRCRHQITGGNVSVCGHGSGWHRNRMHSSGRIGHATDLPVSQRSSQTLGLHKQRVVCVLHFYAPSGHCRLRSGRRSIRSRAARSAAMDRQQRLDRERNRSTRQRPLGWRHVGRRASRRQPPLFVFRELQGAHMHYRRLRLHNSVSADMSV